MNYYECISNLRPESSPNEPPPTIKWNILKLVDAATLDDPEAREAADLLITENMRLIVTAIKKFTLLHPDAEYLLDDLFGEGLLALTTAVRTLAKHYRTHPENIKDFISNADKPGGGVYNLLGYIYVAVYRAIQTCYEIDSSNPISARMRHRNTPKGMNKPTRQVDMPLDFFLLRVEDTFKKINDLEDIEGACETQLEIDIINLKSRGKTLAEVANELDVAESTVWRHRKALYQRYCKQQGIPE